jgi:hypothetical protein
MRRWVSFVLVVLSTLGLAAGAAAWVRSHYVVDIFEHQRDEVNSDLSTSLRWFWCRSSVGRVSLLWTHRRIPHIFPPTNRPMPVVGSTRRSTEHNIAPPVGPTMINPSAANLRFWEWRSFQLVRTSPGLPFQYVAGIGVTLPYWFITLSCAIAPATALRRLRRRMVEGRLRQSGRCKTCGYDLRATPNRCPECGTAVAAKPCAPHGGRGKPVAQEQT